MTGRLSLLPEGTVVQIDALTFLVPSRNFRVEGTLLKGGYVSLATEYALRLLRDVRELPPEEIGQFFGFSDLETRTLIQDLLLDGYVEVAAERVRLSQRGADAFNPATGELTLLNVEPFETNLAFDMVSFAPIENGGNVRLPWLREIEIPNKARASAASDAARGAFRANFGEWRDRTFRSEAAANVRLHAVGEITPLSRTTVPVTVPINYAPGEGIIVEPDFSPLLTRGRRGAREELVVTLNDAIRRITAPEDYADAIALASEWDRGALLRIVSPIGIDPLNWVQLAARKAPGLPASIEPGTRLAGSMVSGSTRTALAEFLETTPGASSEDTPIFWLPAEHPAWGASAELIDVARQLKSAHCPNAGIVLLPRWDGDARDKRLLLQSYGAGNSGKPEAVFDICIGLPPSALPWSLEILVQPGCWAAVLVHVPATQNRYPTPIGYVTRNLDFVARVTTALGEVISKVNENNVLWASSQKDPSEVLDDLDRHVLS